MPTTSSADIKILVAEEKFFIRAYDEKGSVIDTSGSWKTEAAAMLALEANPAAWQGDRVVIVRQVETVTETEVDVKRS